MTTKAFIHILTHNEWVGNPLLAKELAKTEREIWDKILIIQKQPSISEAPHAENKMFKVLATLAVEAYLSMEELGQLVDILTNKHLWHRVRLEYDEMYAEFYDVPAEDGGMNNIVDF